MEQNNYYWVTCDMVFKGYELHGVWAKSKEQAIQKVKQGEGQIEEYGLYDRPKDTIEFRIGEMTNFSVEEYCDSLDPNN